MKDNFQKLRQADNTQKTFIIITIMLVAILEVLDSTIVNVALPSMMPTLGANQEQITWVLTSYIVASAMMIPLTGFLSTRLGQKRLLIINIVGFMLNSFLCGASQTLTMIIIFRLLQGAFGASLIPLSQSILRQTFPLEEQGKAMAIWGLGIMAAPVLGPTIGGFITEHASWRWVFYINVPACAVGLIMAYFFVPPSTTQSQKINIPSVLLMFIGVGSLQVVLDQGNSHQWFSSNYILFLLVMSVFCLTLFIIRNTFGKNPIIKFSVFNDKNFLLSCITLAIFSAIVFGMITLIPIMYETLFGYTAIIAGITMAPLGIGSAIGMGISAPLMPRINVKHLLFTSIAIISVGSYSLSLFNLQTSQMQFMILNGFTGLGMGLLMVPLSTYALATVNKEDITDASGMFSYGRMFGSSVGISLLTTLVTRLTQISWNQLGGNINPFNPNLRLWLQTHHTTLQNKTSIAQLQATLFRQANMLAYINTFRLISVMILILVPLVLMMKRVELKSPIGNNKSTS